MNHRLGVFLMTVLVGSFAGLQAADEAEETRLKHKVPGRWEYVLPVERDASVFDKITQGIPIPHLDGGGFMVKAAPFTLEVDTDGNGKPDEKVKGVGGTVVLKGRDRMGEKFEYAVRVVGGGGSWSYASAGVMAGKVGGESVQLFDLDNDGTWGEIGVDGIIVGKGDVVSRLGNVLNCKGRLLTVQFSPDGRSALAEPYTGEVGTLNLAKGFTTRGKLLSAQVVSQDGAHCFDLGSAKSGMDVPAGVYSLQFGYAEKGNEHVKIRQGKMASFEVRATDDKEIEWGGPISCEFDWAPEGKGKVRVEIPSYFGTAGAEYYQFQPDAKSPKILVLDGESGKEVGNGRFGGC